MVENNTVAILNRRSSRIFYQLRFSIPPWQQHITLLRTKRLMQLHDTLDRAIIMETASCAYQNAYERKVSISQNGCFSRCTICRL